MEEKKAGSLHGANSTWVRAERNRMLAAVGRRAFNNPKGLALASGSKQTKAITEHPQSPGVRNLTTGSLSKPQCEVCVPFCINLTHTGTEQQVGTIKQKQAGHWAVTEAFLNVSFLMYG